MNEIRTQNAQLVSEVNFYPLFWTNLVFMNKRIRSEISSFDTIVMVFKGHEPYSYNGLHTSGH